MAGLFLQAPIAAAPTSAEAGYRVDFPADVRGFIAVIRLILFEQRGLVI